MLGGPASYINHGSTPNARFVKKDGVARFAIQVRMGSQYKFLSLSSVFQALRPIKVGEEITVCWDKNDIHPPLRFQKISISFLLSPPSPLQ